uniref:Uncharacterized protein n=1 Tax=Lactuca sativa TaxID=4236 RepID=A0A9R1X7M4_LACSA|nr:hypothetical protein LSAT_V11C600326420 [Lactuca sativa]
MPTVRHQCRQSIVAPYPPIDAPLIPTRSQTSPSVVSCIFGRLTPPTPSTSPSHNITPTHLQDLRMLRSIIKKPTHIPSSWRSRYVEKLHLELDHKLRLREALETRSKELDKKMLDINPKLQELYTTRTLRQGEKKHFN